MNQIIIHDLKNLHDLDSNSYILFMYDSFGNIANIDNIDRFENFLNITKIETLLKNKISNYKFKTLQNRCYLPIATSILINHLNYKILYVPIMWLKQDISNTKNIYFSILSVLKHIYKINYISKNNLETKLFIHNLNNFDVNTVLKDFGELTNIYETLDNKEDLFINNGYYDSGEQPPIYQNNEFRELTSY